MNGRFAFPPILERALLLFFGLAAIYASLLPIGQGASVVPPDMLFCLVAAWILRRPRAVPLWSVLVLGLLGDVMLSRPIGLGALGLLLAAELLRGNAPRISGAPFPLEWLAVILVFAAMLGGMQALLTLAFADAPSLVALARHLVATAIAYPVAAAALHIGLRLRPGRAGAEPGDRLGRIQ